ncbi:glycoside hydrolase family 88 protein [Pedobacter gandavensis]|uniref:glycoside hydrolase family 88 protein n=1 Tax=Pedobacter TaxID=84567 RepID=UPI001C99B0A0|nr:MULTISPECIES: DUF4350 domain-containing protein [Pedobacter]WGQ10351.1 glycoside hydrolase family 88 protein [Pedobacter gandavensis]
MKITWINTAAAVLLLQASYAPVANAQANKPLSARMAATVMEIWADSLNLNPEQPKPVKWAYDQGVILEGIDGLWKRTGKGEYFKYMQKSMDFFVTKDGVIQRYKPQDYNIDNIKNGRSLLTLYKVTGQVKYFKAATALREQLKGHPRTKEGGFWHKKIYPSQMWLDGLYMGQPFYAEYAALVGDQAAFDDIANQFILMEKYSKDPKTGLLYHGWDESKEQKWANPVTGQSPNFWGRAMGWYAMALVDALEYFPKDHPKRKELQAILNRTAVAIKKYQDPKSGLWYDILDKPNAKGNYPEASASAMFVYSLAKGVRTGDLSNIYLAVAEKAYRGMGKVFVEQVSADRVNLKGTVSVSGLGGKPYRDGSFAYYMSEPVITNDPKGVGAFLLAANEMEWAASAKPGQGKTVLLDNYFNHEIKKDQSGNDLSWHYKWAERANGGFSMWGGIFERNGFKTKELDEGPTLKNLSDAAVYIIVDPDTEKESPKPNYIEVNHIKDLTAWVKAGGLLVLMANDTGNTELDHFNQLAKPFGIQFNKDSKGRVNKNEYETARIDIPARNSIFKNSKQLFVKEFSSLSLSSPAVAIVKDSAGNNVIAISKYGKGTVFVIGDPWLYNEYVDGRKLPADYDNFAAATDLVQWLSQQLPSNLTK